MFKYYFHKRPHSFLSTTNVWVCVTNDRTFNSAKAPAKEFQIQLLHFTQREKFHKHYWGHSKLKTHFELYKVKRIWKLCGKQKNTKTKKGAEWMNGWTKRSRISNCVCFECNATFKGMVRLNERWFESYICKCDVL